MVFKNVANVLFTNMGNLDLNLTKLLNEVSMFCSILLHQHMFVMFCNIGQQNNISFSKTKSALKKMSHDHMMFSQILC